MTPVTMLQTLQDAFELGPGFVVRRALGGSKPQIRVPIRGVGPFVVRPGTRDVDAVRDVFRDHRYRLPAGVDARVQETYEWLLRGERTPLVVDIGAGTGASSLWFGTRYPDAAVIAVEPDPDDARICRINTARAEVDVREVAVGPCADPRAAPVVTVGRLLASRAPDTVPFMVKASGTHALAGDTGWLAVVTVVYVDRVTRAQQLHLDRFGFELHLLPGALAYVRR